MSEKKMDWMYKGVSGLVDRESYLTGRKIDKTFELAVREEKGERIDAPSHESVPVSLLELPSSSSSIATETTRANKLLLDDPLVDIKRKQLEAARKILNNPLKMKKIRELIGEKEGEKSSSVHKKAKKSKSKKKHKHSHKHKHSR